ncbi:Nuclear envelope phosphatase-regulatory subunit 1 -like protein [Toxocara canis]|uniref:Transmembrane protein 188 n=1 Tax=Toxocara canis TaxID=6265 RepID=A0A0B2W071_TOXCA|nr:Nuclear envelope phosphatase-regulatory subunit 1 -like protein [Toxocara canis]
MRIEMDETSSACEDLRYFERRLTEVIQSMHPSATRWRCTFILLALKMRTVVLLIAFCCTLWSAYFWLMDPSIRSVTLLESLQKHIIFSASVPSLLILFAYIGIHNRVVAPSIIASRCRTVLADFSLSCDDGNCYRLEAGMAQRIDHSLMQPLALITATLIRDPNRTDMFTKICLKDWYA